MNPLLQYWYFHLPNFVLAAIMYTLLGRLILSFMAPPDWQELYLAGLRAHYPTGCGGDAFRNAAGAA